LWLEVAGVFGETHRFELFGYPLVVEDDHFRRPLIGDLRRQAKKIAVGSEVLGVFLRFIEPRHLRFDVRLQFFVAKS
jgi:hypothetical protein